MVRKPKHLEDRLFAFLWNRHVENRSVDECQEAANISLDEVIAHRSRRTEQYVAAEQLLEERLPHVAMATMARATQYRLMHTGTDATAASMAKVALDGSDEEGDDRPATITFVIEDAGAPGAPAEASSEPELDCEPDLGREPEPEKPRAYRCYVRPMNDRPAPHERVVLNRPAQVSPSPFVAAKSFRKRDE